MDPNAKKTTLRMIPYGMYVLTAAHPDGRVAAAAINWVTQASFEPPLVAVGVKADSHGHALLPGQARSHVLAGVSRCGSATDREHHAAPD